MNEYPRLVSWSYYDGNNFFSGKKDREVLTKVFITDPKGEEVLKNGKVACLANVGLFERARDPYFKITKQHGFTPRAKKHGELKYNMLEKHSDLKDKLSGIDSVILDYGDYVYINLAYIDNYVNSIVENNPAFSSKNFVFKEHFNVHFLESLINYTPLTLMDRAPIKDYQNKEVPRLLMAVKNQFPELYKELLSISDKAKEIDSQITYVGKSAKLSTLKPSKVELRLTFTERGIFNWDGKQLSRETNTYGKELISQIIIPKDDLVVIVKDDAAVCETTVIVD